MARNRKGRDLAKWTSNRPIAVAGKLRIIGGHFRGRQIAYSGDPITRPMKDDVREAVFNLIGGWVPGKAVFDLFSGSGAIGLEAISRGAARAILVERHFPTARIIRDNVSLLAPAQSIEIVAADAFFWSRSFLKDPTNWPPEPWIVFICPPYDLYVTSPSEMLTMISAFVDAAPPESLVVVESDQRFDVRQLPNAPAWNVREYRPAVISIFKKDFAKANSQN
jgi:16S rRNA (guanine(966)-N(2))-methyltransferase RsmD